jgi:P pilus assembly chaperone PapD
MKKNRIAALLFIALVFIYSCVFQAWALGVRIDKPKVFLTISPGGYDSGEIQVENTGSEEVPIKVYLEDWVYAQQDGGKEFMPKATTPLSCSDWITFFPSDFTLQPGKSQMVRYTVNVPKDAIGGHYSVLFFETTGGDIKDIDQQGNDVLVKVLNRLGALFYIDAEGTVQKTAELQNLTISQKLNSLIISADLINAGNTYISCNGTFNILDKEGFVYARGEFEQAYTLPKDKIALRSAVSTTNLKSGNYDILLTLDFENGGSLVQEGNFTVLSEGSFSSVALKK